MKPTYGRITVGDSKSNENMVTTVCRPPHLNELPPSLFD